MKRQITLLSGLLLATGAIAQVKTDLPTRAAQPAKISVSTKTADNNDNATVKADGDLLWDDDFSGGVTWTMGNEAGGVQGAFEIGNTTDPGIEEFNDYCGAMASTTAANGFAFFNGIQYLLPPPGVGVQNCWIASPAIDFTGVGSIQVKFQQRYRAFNSDDVFIEFSEDGGTNWTFSQQLNITAPTNGPTIQNTLTVDIPTGSSANGKIRFRWASLEADNSYGSGYGWCIDDVEIYEGYGNNMANLLTRHVTGPNGVQYTKFAANQVDGQMVSFGADIKNTGYNDQPNVRLHVTTTGYDEEGDAIASVASFDEDSIAILEANGFPLTTTVGDYPFVMEVISDSTLVQTADDSHTMPFAITSSVAAIDTYDGTPGSMDGQFTMFSDQNPNDFTAIGTVYDIFVDGTIGAVQIGIDDIPTGDEATYNGRLFFGKVAIFGEDGEFIDEYDTESAELVASDYGTLKTLYFGHGDGDDAFTVEAGQQIFVFACSYVGPLDAGQPTGGIPVAFAGLTVDGNTIGLQGEDVENDLVGLIEAAPGVVEAPVVRVDFTDYTGVNEIDNMSDVVVAPNPFVNETAINFTLKAEAEVAVVVTDLAGRTVLTIPAAQYNAGKQSIAIDGSSFKAGVYNYTLTVGNSSVTKRIVKK